MPHRCELQEAVMIAEEEVEQAEVQVGGEVVTVILRYRHHRPIAIVSYSTRNSEDLCYMVSGYLTRYYL